MVSRTRQDSQNDDRSGIPVWSGSPGYSGHRRSLSDDLEVDVAIVGAGFTGLWAAFYLLRDNPNLSIAILERKFAGFGASGRNGGWCSAIFPVSLDRVAKLNSHEAALSLQLAMNDTVTEIGKVVADEGIECHFDQQGFVSLARTSAQLARAHEQIKATESFGLPDQWSSLTPSEAVQSVNATNVQGGIFTEHCALLDPNKLVHGLAEWVESRGGLIFENTTVESIENGSVHTSSGNVTAAVVIRATEAFTPEFTRFHRDIVPLYSLVVATEPLSAAMIKDLFPEGRVAFNDMRNLRIYAQPTADRRVVFGGRGAPYHFGSKVAPEFDVDSRIHEKIVTTLTDFFPILSGVDITHRWGGPLGVPRDWFPSVGFDAASGLAWAGPYVGDGVATSNLAGRILRNLITDKSDDLNKLPLVNHRSPKWEVEPVRWLAVNAGLRAASAADIEERLTNRPSKISKGLERLTGAH